MSEDENQPEKKLSLKDKMSSSIEDIGSKAKDKAKESIQTIGDKTKEKAKEGMKAVGEKSVELANKGITKVGEKASEIMEETLSSSIPKSETQGQAQDLPQRARPGKIDNRRPTNAVEDQIQIWRGWFWSTVAYVFLILISYSISSADSRFALLPIVLLIGFPFYLFNAIVHSIPEIRIGNRVIMSRKNLSLQKQLTFTRTVLRFFSTEMMKNSPMGAFLIITFLIVLVYVIVSPFLGI